MKIWQLTEDKLPPKLPVILSPEIDNNISAIEERNKDNEGAISQWRDSLSAITNQISNPSIAWDNTGTFRHGSNGETHARIFGHNIAYTIETDEMGRNYVDVYYFDLAPEEYGLWECRCRKASLIITKSELRRIIAESIRKVLYN